MGKRKPIYTARCDSVAKMIRLGVECKAMCEVCKASKMVNIQAVADKRGDDFSLMGKRAPCHVDGCAGAVRFFFMHGFWRPMS